MDQPSSSEILLQEAFLEEERYSETEEGKIEAREIAVKAKEFWNKYRLEDLFNPSPEIMEKSEDTPDYILSPGLPSSPIADGGKLMKNTGGLHTWCSHHHDAEYYNRYHRGFAVRNFRMQYKFVSGEIFCISSRGYDIRMSTSDKCLDSSWVGVHGMESVCMVTWRKEVDMTRVGPFYQRCCTNQQTMRSYATTVISEVECLPYDGAYDKDFGQSFEKPFGVVSVVPDTSGHQASSDEYDVYKATVFLREAFGSGLAFTLDETIQTAISAFQHLCRKELKAEDIWVTTLLLRKDRTEHLHLDQRKEHLDVINGVSLGGSGPSSSLGGRRPISSSLGGLGGVDGLGGYGRVFPLGSVPIDAAELFRLFTHIQGVRPCNCSTCRSESDESLQPS